MWFDAFETKIGTLTIAADSDGLRYILFPQNKHDAPERGTWTRDAVRLGAAREQLLEYFDGKRSAFDLPLAPQGTPFQIKVWNALLHIPMGSLKSYLRIANEIGDPKASRAVGTAIGNNPIAFLIPCHRVITSSGNLGGYHWGIDRKSAMIGWEAAKKMAENG